MVTVVQKNTMLIIIIQNLLKYSVYRYLVTDKEEENT